jgi:hypothetical protein
MWAMAVSDFMRFFGFDDCRSTLSLLRCVGALVTGPAMLKILFPACGDALASVNHANRLEIHIPSTQQALSVSRLLLTKSGFQPHPPPIASPIEYAKNVLGYPLFGRTVRAIHNWTLTKPHGAPVECSVVVNISPLSALPTILEYPSTLFMNFLFDGHLHILYPSLTLQRRSLLNVFPKSHSVPAGEGRSPDWFAAALASAKFTIYRSLNDIPSHASHRCSTISGCPATPRSFCDRHTVRIKFLDRAPDEGPLSIPFVAWYLKCCASCGSSVDAREEIPMDYTMGQYVVHETVYGACAP